MPTVFYTQVTNRRKTNKKRGSHLAENRNWIRTCYRVECWFWLESWFQHAHSGNWLTLLLLAKSRSNGVRKIRLNDANGETQRQSKRKSKSNRRWTAERKSKQGRGPKTRGKKVEVNRTRWPYTLNSGQNPPSLNEEWWDDTQRWNKVNSLQHCLK